MSDYTVQLQKNGSQKNLKLFKKFRKTAFTLAEVLITLGIIGVVAAMTLPTLLSRNDEKVAINKLKKIYSVMSQAYLMSVNDNGYADAWHVDNGFSENTAKQLAPYIVPYLKVLKECGTERGCLGYTKNVNRLNGEEHNTDYESDKRYYKLILADGSYIWLRTASGQYCKTNERGYSDGCARIFIDVNGPKGLNTAGIDIFSFVITPKGVFPSLGNDCKKSSEGWDCSSYILTHDNMNYLH